MFQTVCNLKNSWFLLTIVKKQKQTCTVVDI